MLDKCHEDDCRTVTKKLLSGDPIFDCDCGAVSAYEACTELFMIWRDTIEENVPEQDRSAVVKEVERAWKP